MSPRIRPKKNYSVDSTWDELYSLTDDWKSDMEFYGRELELLRHRVDENFVWLIKDGNFGNLQTIIKKIDSTILLHRKISSKIKEHLIKLEKLVMNVKLEDNQKVRDENLVLESQFSVFENYYSVLNGETFFIIQGIENEQLLLAF